MSAQQLKYTQNDSEAWKRLLGLMTDENINMKIRLSEIVTNGLDKSFLVDIENFQARLLEMDEVLRFLRSEISALDKPVATERFDPVKIFPELTKKMNRLRSDITIAEERFFG